MPCPAADAIPPENVAAIVRDVGGATLAALLPTNAVFSRRVIAPETLEEGGQVLFVAPAGPFDVKVAAPAPLDVTVTLDPGACMAFGRVVQDVAGRVEGVTVTVRVGERVLATWRLGRTAISVQHELLVLRVAEGAVAFDTRGRGDETLRTLLEVPALAGWFAAAPDLVARLGPRAPGAVQEAARAARGGAGDPALAGARLLPGAGVAGARVWVDGIALGRLGTSLVAPVGGIVTVRWEGAADGAVEAALGPGVDLELRVDGTARVVARPKGLACARHDDVVPLVVCRRDTWHPGKSFPIGVNACGPDGALTVTAAKLPPPNAPEWARDQQLSDPRLPSRTLHAGLAGDYTFAATTDGLGVTWAPRGGGDCAPTGSDAPGWDADLSGHALSPAGERLGVLFGFWPFLAPIADGYAVDHDVLAFPRPVTVVTPDLGIRVTFGREGELVANPLAWDWGGPHAQIGGAVQLGTAAMKGDLTLWPAHLELDEGTVWIEGKAWITRGVLCDGTPVTATRARFIEQDAPKGEAPGKGPHVVRSMGVDRKARTMWFVVEPEPGWPVEIAGLPAPYWAGNLSDAVDRVVICPLGP